MHLDALKGQGKEVKFLQCNNASEQGGKLATLCQEWGIQMEYTALSMPQQNSVVE